MKTTIRIQNFKSLEDVTLELAPTTVFLGPNGAGKSSVLKCLEFVSKNLENINSQKLSPTIYKLSNDVDLGSFKEVVINNDLNKKLIFEFKHKSLTLKEYFKFGLEPAKLELQDLGLAPEGFVLKDFDKKKRSRMDSQQQEESRQILKKQFLEKWLANEFFLSFSDIGWSELLMLNFSSKSRFEFVSKYFINLNLSLELSLTNSEEKTNFESLSLIENNTKSEIAIANKFDHNAISTEIILKNVPTIFNNLINENLHWDFSGGWNNFKNVVKELILWHIDQQRGSNKKSINKSKEELTLFGTIAVLILLFEFFPNLIKRFLSIDHLPSVRKSPPHSNKLVKNKKVELSNEMSWAGHLTSYGKLQVILFVDKMDQNRYWITEDLEFNFTDEDNDFIAKNSKAIKRNFQEYTNPGVLKLIHTLRDLKLAKNLYLKKESGFIKIMVETLSGAHINFSEASSGLIQLFPILAAITFPQYDNPDRPEFIYVEQPELHLHPGLQTRIPEICSNIQDTEVKRVYSQTKFVIETHSEHLIRGYQLLIAQGKIKPQHIRFYYFNPVDNKTEVVNLKVDKLGNFITPWPNGFFSDAYDLTLKLLKTQLERRN